MASEVQARLGSRDHVRNEVYLGSNSVNFLIFVGCCFLMDFMLLICLFLLLRCWYCGGRDVVTVVVVLVVVRDSGFTVRVGLRGSGLKKFRFKVAQAILS